MRVIVFLGEVGCGEVISEFCIKIKLGFFKGGDIIILLVGSLLGDCKKVELSMK